MTESDVPSALFRKTSFTIRQRFTPASACSTRTRIRPSFRLARLSAAVSSPPAGFFFRLTSLRPCWLVPLEAAVLVQDRARWIGDPLPVGDALVRHTASVAATEVIDALAARLYEDHVLVAVDLLPAAVVRRLFFRVFRPLAPPLRAVDDQRRSWPRPRRGLPLALRQDAQVVEGIAQDGQQSLQPMIHLRLAQAEQFGHDHLQRIGLEVDQEEKQLLGRLVKHR